MAKKPYQIALREDDMGLDDVVVKDGGPIEMQVHAQSSQTKRHAPPASLAQRTTLAGSVARGSPFTSRRTRGAPASQVRRASYEPLAASSSPTPGCGRPPCATVPISDILHASISIRRMLRRYAPPIGESMRRRS